MVYDIGSGTGSIAVEMAALSNTVKVYALEQKPEAAELIRQNKEAFHLENIEVIETKAPDGMGCASCATHALSAVAAESLGRFWMFFIRKILA